MTTVAVGRSILTLAVISIIRKIPVGGGRTTPVKKGAIPTTADPPG
jgi:hypothetical protein